MNETIATDTVGSIRPAWEMAIRLTKCILLFVQKPLISGNGMIGMEQGEVETQCCRPITWISTYTLRSKRIDVISRILFPLIFALFNVAYWSTYINAGGGENANTWGSKTIAPIFVSAMGTAHLACNNELLHAVTFFVFPPYIRNVYIPL